MSYPLPEKQQSDRSKRNGMICVMTFGTFDCFHPGHLSYLEQASLYGDLLVTVVARTSTVQKVKARLPRENNETRMEALRNCRIDNHHVVLGHISDYMYWIKEYRPDVIALGYDQDSFVHLLEDCMQEYELDTRLVRLNAHKPDIFKSSLRS